MTVLREISDPAEAIQEIDAAQRLDAQLRPPVYHECQPADAAASTTDRRPPAAGSALQPRLAAVSCSVLLGRASRHRRPIFTAELISWHSNSARAWDNVTSRSSEFAIELLTLESCCRYVASRTAEMLAGGRSLVGAVEACPTHLQASLRLCNGERFRLRAIVFARAYRGETWSMVGPAPSPEDDLNERALQGCRCNRRVRPRPPRHARTRI